MPDVTVKKRIEAPPDVVFARATDFCAAPEIIRSIVSVRMLTEGPVDVGTRFVETRLVLHRESTQEIEVTVFEPPLRYALGGEVHGHRYRTEIRFNPEGAGTEVEMKLEATPVTSAAKALYAAMGPIMRTVMEACGKDLDDLKTAIENGRA